MTGPDPGAGYIVDASVALKWLIEEDGSEAALSQGQPAHGPCPPGRGHANTVSVAEALFGYRFFGIT
jgi:hypothetical protein